MPFEIQTSSQFLYWVEKSEERRSVWKGAADLITKALDDPQRHMITE